MGPRNQGLLEERRSVLVYTSEPFATRRRFAGGCRVELWAASTAPRTAYAARVSLVLDRTSYNLADGISIVDGAATPKRVVVDCGPVAFDAPRDSALRIVVSGPTLPNETPFPQTSSVSDIDADPLAGLGASHAIFHDTERRSAVYLPLVDDSDE
jgi:predicted acyl esterase